MSEIIPTTELERAYVQARSWTSSHAWKRGTSQYNADHYAQAMGIYLAMVRNQALNGTAEEVTQTLASLTEFKKHANTKDLLAVVRVICSITEEVRDSQMELSSLEQISDILSEAAFKFSEMLKDDKSATVAALTVIRKTIKMNVFESQILSNEIADMENALVECVEKLQELSHSGASEKALEKKRESIVRAFTSNAIKFRGSLEIVEAMVKSTNTFLAQYELQHASAMCSGLVLYIDYVKYIEYSNRHLGPHSVSKGTDKNVTTSATPGQKKVDDEIFSRLSELTNLFMVRGDLVSARECLIRLVPSGARLGQFRETAKRLDSLVVVALVLDDDYAIARQTFDAFFSQSGISCPDELKRFARTQNELLIRLEENHSKFFEVTLDALKETLPIAGAWLSEGHLAIFLENIIRILETKADESALKKTLAGFWEYAGLLTSQVSLKSFKLPLGLLTERLFDATQPTAFEYCRTVHGKISSLDAHLLVLFWQSLIKARADKQGENSVTLIPLLGQLALQQFTNGKLKECCETAARILSMDKSTISLQSVGRQNLIDYADAVLFCVAPLTVVNDKSRRDEAVQQYVALVMANLNDKDISDEFYRDLREYQRRFPNEFFPLSAIFTALIKAT